MHTRTIATAVHGRYLYVDRGPNRLLAGFHGYAELADAHLAELQQVPGIDRWSLAAVQALHPFYPRNGIGASWMTSLDRELAIEDNIEYVRNVIAALPQARTLVFCGFSQGAAMAVRAAAHIPCAGLVLLGGDIPPEIAADPDLRLPPVLLGRGNADTWYTQEKFEKDSRYLDSVTQVTPCVFDGGHEWTDVFRTEIGRFLSVVAGD